MAWFRVVAVNEDARPLARVGIEAINLTNRTTSAVVETNRAGEALFTGLAGPHFFRVRNRRTSGEVGGRHYTGTVNVQIVGFDTTCTDFVVDADGGGTHTTLAAAVAAAITAIGTSGQRTIWLCGSVTEGNIDIGGLGTSATIIITSANKRRVRITGAANANIFVQNSAGGNIAGGLVFQNIGLRIPPGTYAVLDINALSELRNLIFEDCEFDGGYLCQQDNLDSMGNIYLQVHHCTGSLLGFFNVAGSSATLAVDILQAFENNLTLTRWWNYGGTPADPNFARIQGGIYFVPNGLTFADGDEFYWQSLILIYSGTGAAFTTPATSFGIRDLAFSNIVFRVAQASAYFGEFGSAALNNNFGLFLKDIFGHAVSGLTVTATNFINVDTNYLNVHAGNILCRGGWTNCYTGPASTEPVTTCFGNDLLVTGYLRVGSCTAPTNVTDGDLTAVRAFITDRLSVGSETIPSVTSSLLLGVDALWYRSGANIMALGVGDTLRIDDADFTMFMNGPNPRTTYAPGDFMEFDRSNNSWVFTIGAGAVPAQAVFVVDARNTSGASASFYFRAQGAAFAGPAWWRQDATDTRLKWSLETPNVAGNDPDLVLFRFTGASGAEVRNTMVTFVNSSGRAAFAGALEIAGDLDHNGSNIGFFGVAPVARAAAYTPTNVTTDRSYDADTVVVAELADVVGTLIADLQAYGLLQ